MYYRMGVVLGVIHYPIIPLPIISLYYYTIILLSYYSISLSILYLSYLAYVSRQSTPLHPNGFPAAFTARIAGSIPTVDYGDVEFGFAR